jgi:hypothetical protein
MQPALDGKYGRHHSNAEFSEQSGGHGFEAMRQATIATVAAGT